MIGARTFPGAIGLLLLAAMSPPSLPAQAVPEVSVGVDLVSRYVWRGMNLGDAPSVQPSIGLAFKGWEVGTWGAYSLANEITEGDEIDFWLGYSRDLPDGGSFGLVLTDYYYPNGGAKLSNFQDHDDEDGPGAHTLEIGASFTFSEAVPITLAGYMNVHNDAGNNVYLQVAYPMAVGETSLDLFLGVTPGSDENPGYYGTDAFSVLDVGLTATKEVELSDRFSLPVSGSWIVNPNLDVAYLVVGIRL